VIVICGRSVVFSGYSGFLQVEVGIWTRKLKALAIFACIFIILGAFIFGLTFTQSILADKNGVKADKSNYTCSS
jgi:hypothetical protein